MPRRYQRREYPRSDRKRDVERTSPRSGGGYTCRYCGVKCDNKNLLYSHIKGSECSTARRVDLLRRQAPNRRNIKRRCPRMYEALKRLRANLSEEDQKKVPEYSSDSSSSDSDSEVEVNNPREVLSKQLRDLKVSETEASDGDPCCKICLTNVSNVRASCGHMYCPACVGTLISGNMACAFCRKPFQSLLAIYF